MQLWYMLLFLFSTVELYAVYLCVCVCVSGSHRIIETDYDDGITVVSSGGWGQCLLCSESRNPTQGERES